MKRNVFKKLLALTLALCMCLSLAAPAGASWWDLWSTLTDDSASAADDTSTDASSENQPFSRGTKGSNSFRIPALVTLSNGTLVAAADARWNSTFDGGGNDTLVARSTDNGASWEHTFANYLGDNGDVYNGKESTCFIDPALAVTSNNTIYMLCDLYPYGVALNGEKDTQPSTEVGFTAEGYLKLCKNEETDYSYYLEGGAIYYSDGTKMDTEGYTVDDHFNILKDGETVSNLFYRGAPYQVVRTGFLYLTSSTDGGQNWSAPTLLNLKTSSEMVCLAAPGRGLVTSSGRIVFPVYSYNGGQESQKLSFVYSDNGSDWYRSDSFSGCTWSSESAVVELSDGTLRFFYRNGNRALCYVDYKNGSWGSMVNTQIPTNSNTQISAISYSKELDGKQVILVSCPAGEGNNGSADSSAAARKNGKIFTFTVGENNALTLENTYSVESVHSDDFFMYSCLTELQNGDIAILYEDNESGWGAGDDYYYQMTFKTVAASELKLTADDTGDNNGQTTKTVKDDTTGVSVTAPGLTGVTVTTTTAPAIEGAETDKVVAYEITPVAGETNYTSAATVTFPLPDGWTGTTRVKGFVVGSDNSVETLDAAVSGSTVSVTFPHFSTGGIYYAAAATGDGSTGNAVEVELKVGDSHTVENVSAEANSYITGDAAYIATAKVETKTTASTTQKKLGNKYTGLSSNDQGVIYDGKGNYMVVNGSTISATTNIEDATVFTITKSGNSVYIKAGNYYLSHSDNSLSSSSSSRTSGWSYSSDSGFYYYYYYYLAYNNAWTVTTSGSAYFYHVETEEIPGSTSNDLTFTGVGEDTTTVTVGDTTYNVTVKAKETTETKTISKGANFSIEDDYAYDETKSDSKNLVTVSGRTVTAGETLGSGATVVAEKTNDGGKVTDRIIYTINVVDGTLKTIKVNETAELSVELGDGQTVEWSSGDSSYVGVAGKYDANTSKYTNTGVIIGYQVTTTPVAVTATIKNADGTVASTQRWLVTVTEGTADSNTYSRSIHIEVDKIENCTVYYSINGGALIPVDGTGVLLNDESNTGHFNIMFFAKPDDGYALTYMKATGSSDQYYTLSNGVNPDGTDSDAWPFESSTASTVPNKDDSAWKSDHGFRWSLIEGNMTIEQMKVLFSNAIALGCDGATTLTKNESTGLDTTLSFVAQKLPTMTKEIVSITKKGESSATDYTPGTAVEIGDNINYTITVTRYATDSTYGTITYSDEKLTDELTQNSGITDPDMGTSTTSDQNFPYNTSLELTTDNFATVVQEGTITNTAELSYSYKSQYSSGSLTASAAAVAEVTVSLPTYVVDFGLPVTITLDDAVTSTYGTIQSVTDASQTYGTVSGITGSGKTFTYTPNKVLTGAEHLTIVNETGGNYGVTILPASNVLYEEGFLTQNTQTNRISWTESKATDLGNQQLSKVGSEGESNFGYDDIYKNINKADGYWTASGLNEVSSSTNKLSTSFYGNGFDLIGSCGPNTRCVMVSVVPVDGGKSQTAIIDTYYSKDTIHQVPLAHLMFDKETTYNVSIRAYGPLYGTHTTGVDGAYEDAESAIFADLAAMGIDEDDVEFISMNEVLGGDEAGVAVVDANSTSTNDSGDGYVQIDGFRVYRDSDHASYPSKEQNITYTNILDAVGSTITAYTESEEKSNIDVLEYEKSGGPQNEIYLASGDNRSVQIKLSGNNIPNTIQVSLRAVNGATQWNNTDISSTVEMYYDVTVVKSNGEAVATITNTGNNMLAIGNVKLPNTVTAEGPSAASTEALVYSLNVALMLVDYEVGGETEPVFQPDIQVKDSSVSLFSKKVVTLTVTTSTDVETLEINGKYLRPTNAWMVKMGWSDTYTYVYVDTVKKGTTKTYTIVASDINGNQYSYPYEA